MGLVPSSEIYKEASKKGYAVGVFPAVSIDFIQGVIEAVKKTKLPALLTISNFFFKELNDLEAYVEYVNRSVKRIDIPMALHLDHGDVQTYEEIVKCVKSGFTSVMFDASRLPLDENIKLTREVVNYCHKHNVTVEGMVGHMPLGDTGEFTAVKKKEIEDIGLSEEHYFTDPKEAEIFEKSTNIDVIAISVGTIHGLTKNRKVKIDVERLKEIKRRTNAYLTVHGGSGVPKGELIKLIKNGVVKVNVFSAVMKALTQHLRRILEDENEEMIFRYGNRFVIEKEVTKYIKMFQYDN
jgi:fructose-bisphosphate aldolase class II